jgi:hypothetical protein
MVKRPARPYKTATQNRFAAELLYPDRGCVNGRRVGSDGEDELRAQPVVYEIHHARGPSLSRGNPWGTGGSRAAAVGRKGAHVLPSMNIIAFGSMKTLGWRRDARAPSLLPMSVYVCPNKGRGAEPVCTVFLATKKEMLKTINSIFEQAHQIQYRIFLLAHKLSEKVTYNI